LDVGKTSLFSKENRRPLRKFIISTYNLNNVQRIIILIFLNFSENRVTGEKNLSVTDIYSDSSNNVPGPSTSANATIQLQQKDVHSYSANSTRANEIFANSNCTCCPEHKNNGTSYNALNIFN
jgi:hypothetical protein